MARNGKAKPYVANYPPLRDWLHEHQARCNWQVPIGDPREPRAYVESWQAPGWRSDVLLVIQADQLGWNVYTPDGGNEIRSALADALARVKS